jgi:hypothetical protein
MRLNFNRSFDNWRCPMLAIEFTSQRGDYATSLPPCPNCGRPMHLTRTMSRPGDSDLCVFKCGECAVWLSESADDRHAI